MSQSKSRQPVVPGTTGTYAVLPLRDIVVFPHMIVPLFVGREKSIRALEEAVRTDRHILLATQRVETKQWHMTAEEIEAAWLLMPLVRRGKAARGSNAGEQRA